MIGKYAPRDSCVNIAVLEITSPSPFLVTPSPPAYRFGDISKHFTNHYYFYNQEAKPLLSTLQGVRNYTRIKNIEGKCKESVFCSLDRRMMLCCTEESERCCVHKTIKRDTEMVLMMIMIIRLWLFEQTLLTMLAIRCHCHYALSNGSGVESCVHT